MYATVPSVAIFGLNEWGVRAPEALFGTLGSAILAVLVYQLSKNKQLSLWSAFFLAILPWHIHYSRAAFEVVLMLDLAMLGTIMLLRKKNLLPAIFFCLALYTYSTAVLFVPLIILAILVLKRIFPWRFMVLCLNVIPLFSS
jgi:4-amino-4-deoxy-L-arabinose transferase-like glycosyltransferase